MAKVSFITGFLGMDGSYISDFLLEKGYHVWGLIRKSSSLIEKHQNVCHLIDHPRVTLRFGDLSDGNCLSNIIQEIKNTYPDLERLEIYNFGAISHVGLSFKMPEHTANIDGLGPLRLLEAIRHSGISDKCRFLQASSSEIFGGATYNILLNENSPLQPKSPYSCAKAYGYFITKNYRESYNLFACNSIAFNHCGERRDPIFLTRKVTKTLSEIISGSKNKLVLGNIDTFRDEGYAKDYVKMMYAMLQHDVPDDYVLSTGESHSNREFIEKAFAYKGFNIKWKGEGLNEIGYDANTGRELIFISEEFYRPAEVNFLLGDSSKARQVLGWTNETSFDDLIKLMVDHDCKN